MEGGGGTGAGPLWGCLGITGDMRRHVEAKHILTQIQCSYCGKPVKTRDSLRKHMKADHSVDAIWDH